jgi:hypothetical protein
MRKIEERGEPGQIWSLKNKKKPEGGRGGANPASKIWLVVTLCLVVDT